MKRKKLLKAVICFFVLFVSLCLVLGSVAVVYSAEHDCCGENCSVCLFFSYFKDLMKAIFFLGFQLALLSVFFTKLKAFVQPESFNKSFNPVFMKVKLSN